MPSSFLHKRELFEQQMQQRQLIYCQQQNNTDESSLVKVLNQFIQDYPQWQQHIGITQTTTTKVNNNKNSNNDILENTHVPYLQQSMDQNSNNALLSKASIYIFMVNKQDQQKWLETISHSTQEEVDLLSSSPPSVTSSSSSTCPPKYVIFIDANSNDLPPSPPLLPAQHYHTIHLQQVNQVPILLNSILSRLVNKSMVNEPTFPNSLDLNNVIKSYNEAHQRLFLFDYDGTLTPIVSRPEMALPSAPLLDYLNKLCKDPCNTVWIISGRDQKFLQDCFGHLHEVGLSAEHGSFMKLPGETHWVDMLENMSLDWKQQAIDIFMKYTNQLPGTEMEEKKSSITWHYRNAHNPTAAFEQSEHCYEEIQRIPAVDILVGKMNLEIRSILVNKGNVVKRICEKQNYDYIMCAGDDKTDEDMFRALINNQHAHTILVGPSTKKTLAPWHVENSYQVVDLLGQLVQSSSSL